jgi:hypothetical protein
MYIHLGEALPCSIVQPRFVSPVIDHYYGYVPSPSQLWHGGTLRYQHDSVYTLLEMRPCEELSEHVRPMFLYMAECRVVCERNCDLHRFDRTHRSAFIAR